MLSLVDLSVVNMFIAVVYSLLQRAFSLHISIDGERNGNDSIDCIQNDNMIN